MSVTFYSWWSKYLENTQLGGDPRAQTDSTGGTWLYIPSGVSGICHRNCKVWWGKRKEGLPGKELKGRMSVSIFQLRWGKRLFKMTWDAKARQIIVLLLWWMVKSKCLFTHSADTLAFSWSVCVWLMLCLISALHEALLWSAKWSDCWKLYVHQLVTYFDLSIIRG